LEKLTFGCKRITDFGSNKKIIIIKKTQKQIHIIKKKTSGGKEKQPEIGFKFQNSNIGKISPSQQFCPCREPCHSSTYRFLGTCLLKGCAIIS